jgi:O-antigen/teichoic acid export membrane protein
MKILAACNTALLRWIASTKAFAAHTHVREFSANTLWAMTAYGTMVGIEKLILMPFLGRHLSEAAFGMLLLERNAATVLSSGLFAGLHNLLLRRNQEWLGPEKAVAVRSAALLGSLLAAASFFLLLAILFLRQETGWLQTQAATIAAFAVWGMAGVINNIWQTYWRMRFCLPLFYGLQIFNGLALLLIIPFYLVGGETGIYWGWVAAGIVPLLVTWVVARRDRDWRGERISWLIAEVKLMLRQMWVFVWGVVGQGLLQNLDRFIIGWLLGAAAVGAYFKVTNTAYMIVVPVEPLSGVVLSMVAQEQVGRQTLAHLRRLHVFMLAIIVGVTVLGILFGQPLTDLLYGAGTFASGSRLYWIILAGCICGIVSILLRGMLIVYAPAHWIVWHDTLSLLVLLIAGVGLTWWYGVIGTAAAVALTLAFRSLMSETVVWLAIRQKLATRSFV